MRLQDAVCVVTGGATGQGRAVASRFAAEGASVLILDVDSDRGRATVAEIRDQGHSATFLQCDVSDEGNWVQARAYLSDKFGDASVLYNNAAVFLPEDRSVLDMEVDHLGSGVWQSMSDPYSSPANTSCPGMIERGGGSVINIASIRASLGTTVPQDAYAASKGRGGLVEQVARR